MTQMYADEESFYLDSCELTVSRHSDTVLCKHETT